MEKLKPCPFCGGEAEFVRESVFGMYNVCCKKCKCQTAYQFTFFEGENASKQKAAEVWNRRADHETN